jgi:NAD(P)-dependent dehydrogenase (short-subunit alcohol dehydrogenase family)
MARYEGKVVVVTGAASGNGAACVRRLWEERAAVALADSDRRSLPSWGRPSTSSFVESVVNHVVSTRFVKRADGVAARARACAFAGEDGGPER